MFKVMSIYDGTNNLVFNINKVKAFSFVCDKEQGFSQLIMDVDLSKNGKVNTGQLVDGIVVTITDDPYVLSGQGWVSLGYYSVSFGLEKCQIVSLNPLIVRASFQDIVIHSGKPTRMINDFSKVKNSKKPSCEVKDAGSIKARFTNLFFDNDLMFKVVGILSSEKNFVWCEEHYLPSVFCPINYTGYKVFDKVKSTKRHYEDCCNHYIKKLEGGE